MDESDTLGSFLTTLGYSRKQECSISKAKMGHSLGWALGAKLKGSTNSTRPTGCQGSEDLASYPASVAHIPTPTEELIFQLTSFPYVQ